MKVHLLPTFNKQDQGDGGIRRIIDAQRKYLPEFGIELVDDIEQAELTVGHGAIKNVKPGAPFVSHSHGLYWSEYKWGDWGHGTNKAVIDALICADAITVPSEWVKRAFWRIAIRAPCCNRHR